MYLVDAYYVQGDLSASTADVEFEILSDDQYVY